MFKFSFARAREALSAFFLPIPPTMDDPFALLFHHTRRRGKDTKAFFLACLLGVKSSPDPAQAFARFKIKRVEVKKKSAAPEHEFILITTRDVEDRQDRVLILERTVDPAKAQ